MLGLGHSNSWRAFAGIPVACVFCWRTGGMRFLLAYRWRAFAGMLLPSRRSLKPGNFQYGTKGEGSARFISWVQSFFLSTACTQLAGTPICPDEGQ